MFDIRFLNRLKAWLYFIIYRFNIHLDLIFYHRWRWRKYFKKNSEILEIGPGGGPWTIELLLRGNRVTCVDIDAKSLDRLRRKVELFPLRNKDLSLIQSHICNINIDRRYDQIILFEVLEHVQNDVAVLENLTKLLKKDGELLISSPSSDYTLYYGEHLSTIEDGGHVRKGYSFWDYEAIFKDLDFEIVYKDSCCGFFTQKLEAFRRMVSEKLKVKNIFCSFMLFFLRWVTFFDFLYPRYPTQINFVIAAKRGR